MILLAGFFLLFIIALLIIAMIGTSRVDKANDQRKELMQLQAKIKTKHLELASLENNIYNKTRNKETNLPKSVDNVLNIYQDSNIKIPLDIIEELQYTTLSDEQQLYDFIENQRNHWKLENNKKPYKRK